jgi:hypothetical protein
MKKKYLALISVGLLNLILGMGDEMGWFLVPGLALMWVGFLGLRRLKKAEQAASATDEKEER